jgi:hypothetical protein
MRIIDLSEDDGVIKQIAAIVYISLQRIHLLTLPYIQHQSIFYWRIIMSDDKKEKRTMVERAEDMGEAIGKGAEKAGKAIRKGAHDARERIEEGADQAGKAMRKGYKSFRKGMKEGNEAEKEKNQEEE